MDQRNAVTARRVLARALDLPETALPLPEPMSLGMTNRSFLGEANGTRYVIRLPGEGSEKLVSRRQEAASHQAVAGLGLTDDVVALDPETGIKITVYLPQARTCDPKDPADLARCMQRLRQLHEMDLKVSHVFDPFRWIEDYEALWGGKTSVYSDYVETKAEIQQLEPWLSPPDLQRRLCHVDAVPDNFLLLPEAEDRSVRLIDWEYAGMADPLMDLGMFAVYAGYEKEALDRLTDLYDPSFNAADRRRVYGWAAVSGLLWSNWCEFKAMLGVDFGDYALQQYRLAKYYSKLVQEDKP